MFRYISLLAAVALAGCSTVDVRDYKPYKNREKNAFARADLSVTIQDVQTNFQAYVETEVAWAGIISDIRFKETERTIQVAFDIEYRDFDWQDYGGGRPYRLSPDSAGRFKAGWTVDKPARIGHLKTLAQPGYMIVVYGKPWRRVGEVVQLAATAVRPIKAGDFEVLPETGEMSGK